MATFSTRKNKDGTISFRAIVRTKGCPPQFRSFKTEEEAKEWAFQTEKSLKNKVLNKTPLFKDALERYRIEILPKKSHGMQLAENIYLKFWESRFADKYIDEITPAEIEDFSMEIYKILNKRTNSPLTAESRRKYLMTLSYVFRICITEWRWINFNPVSLVKKDSEKLNQKKERKETKALFDPRLAAFYKKIKEFMVDNKISQHELAKRTGCALSTIQHSLNPSTNITFNMLIKICDSLGLKFELKFND